MLDPDLFLQAAGGSAGQAGSSSSSPSFSDGLLPDTVTMLQMLHGAKALAEGALQLVLQVYACKQVGKPLPLPQRQEAPFKAADVAAALESFERSELLQLRSFLLQVGGSCVSVARSCEFQTVVQQGTPPAAQSLHLVHITVAAINSMHSGAVVAT
jgi:hypothetical protein